MNIFDFNEQYILEDERALLRPLALSDVELLLRFSLNEPELWHYSVTTAAGYDNLCRYIARAIEDRNQQTSYAFIVFDKATQQYAGSTRFYDIQLTHNTLQLGYTWYGKAFQRTGLNRHCKFLLLDFAFGFLNMERVEFRADDQNERSIKAMKAIGCVEEGTLRQNCSTHRGTRRNSIVLSILKNEWEGSVKAMLSNKKSKPY